MAYYLLSKYYKYKLLVLLVFLSSLLVLFFTWIYSLNYYKNLSEKSFEYSANENIQFLEKRIMKYKHALISVSALAYSTKNFNYEIWHEFIETLDLKNSYPGFQAVGYSPVIYDKDLDDFYQKNQLNDNEFFSISPSGNRDIYIPVQYIEPMNNKNKIVIGFDLNSEAKRKEVLEKARDSGLISTSDKLKLIQEVDNDNIQAGIIMYLPIYKIKNLTTVEQRREEIVGFISGVFRMNDLMSNIISENSLLEFEIFDSKKENESNLLYKSFNNNHNPKFKLKKELKVNDKTWIVNFYSTKDFENEHSYEKPLLITLISFIIYFILLTIILFIIRSKNLLQLKTNQLKDINDKLISTQDRYKSLVEQAITGIYIFQGDKFLFVNNKFCEMFGYTKEEILTKLKPTDVVDYQDLERAKKEIEDRYSGEKKFSHYKVKGIKKDKTTIWIEIFGNAVEIDGIPSVSGVVLDITKNIEAQQELENIFNFSNIGLGVVSSDIKWYRANNQLLSLLNYSNEELYEKEFLNFVDVEEKEKIDNLIKNLLDKEISGIQTECNFIKKDGKKVETILTITSFCQNNKLEYLLISILDISEIKLKEQLLNQQSKLAMMGEMIGNIAHQWKQPLSLISTTASGIKLQLEMDSLDKERSFTSLDSIMDATKYLATTIDDFRNFFRPRNMKSRFNIESIVDKSLTLISSGFKNKEIEIVREIENISCYSFENDFIQIFMNILNNAKDALLNIQTNRLIFISIKFLPDEKNLEIVIKDNAGGIAENIIDKIFEPYFTTKDATTGTGIGLYMVNDIISKHLKGEIEVSNSKYFYLEKEYKGAEFKITVPIELE